MSGWTVEPRERTDKLSKIGRSPKKRTRKKKTRIELWSMSSKGEVERGGVNLGGGDDDPGCGPGRVVSNWDLVNKLFSLGGHGSGDRIFVGTMGDGVRRNLPPNSFPIQLTFPPRDSASPRDPH